MPRAEQQNIGIEHIQPGKPQQSAYVERYNRIVRYRAGAGQGCTLARTCGHGRPSMALGGITSMQKNVLSAFGVGLKRGTILGGSAAGYMRACQTA